MQFVRQIDVASKRFEHTDRDWEELFLIEFEERFEPMIRTCIRIADSQYQSYKSRKTTRIATENQAQLEYAFRLMLEELRQRLDDVPAPKRLAASKPHIDRVQKPTETQGQYLQRLADESNQAKNWLKKYGS